MITLDMLICDQVMGLETSLAETWQPSHQMRVHVWHDGIFYAPPLKDRDLLISLEDGLCRNEVDNATCAVFCD